jgi:Glycosyltransferase family 92
MSSKIYAITSIQRDREPWLLEWLSFHMVVGFNRFYLYLHNCADGSVELAQRLARHYPIAVHPIDVPVQPQLIAYQHAWNSYGAQVDWMAFLDGDEFLFPTQAPTIAEALARYERTQLSALGVYWMCYGSSGHLEDPPGLLMENFTRHAHLEFIANKHVKSIVRGGSDPVQMTGSHRFETVHGTFDEQLRSVTHGCMQNLTPSYQQLRINHYATQSYDFFKRRKQHAGAADGDPNMVRPDAWFEAHDLNEFDDGVRWRFLLAVKLKMREIATRLQTTP